MTEVSYTIGDKKMVKYKFIFNLSNNIIGLILNSFAIFLGKNVKSTDLYCLLNISMTYKAMFSFS